MPVKGEFDHVIVGAGSAGCVLANRLSADPKCRVALLEAGGRDINPWIHIPVGYFQTMHNPNVDWCYQTESEEGLNGRKIDWPRGKVLGGSSSINGLLYVRGQAEDYDRWRQMGNVGWSWDDVFPLFKRAEGFESGGNAYHGGSGPLGVVVSPNRRSICDAWLESAVNAGYERNPDYNGACQDGVGHFQVTVKNGRRCSAAVAYLHPIKKRSNLSIFTKVTASRVLFEGKRAVGISYLNRSGEEESIRSKSDVILSAGSIGSPQVMMLSGIGDANELQSLGIECIQHHPSVGKNLQDHLQARLVFKCLDRTINEDSRSLPRKAAMAAEYAMFRTGPMSMAASFVVGFLRTGEHVATPDVQFHVQPWSADSIGRGVHPFAAFTASVCQLRPESRGKITLVSKNPLDKPKIRANYLDTETDRRTMVSAVKLARQISTLEPVASKITEEYQPGEKFKSDEEILEWIRKTSTTIYHPTGTCCMGQGKDAVVDERLRVREMHNLRVVDCSIMPEIVSGNTNAPAIMIGEKASDMIIADRRN